MTAQAAVVPSMTAQAAVVPSMTAQAPADRSRIECGCKSRAQNKEEWFAGSGAWLMQTCGATAYLSTLRRRIRRNVTRD